MFEPCRGPWETIPVRDRNMLRRAVEWAWEGHHDMVAIAEHITVRVYNNPVTGFFTHRHYGASLAGLLSLPISSIIASRRSWNARLPLRIAVNCSASILRSASRSSRASRRSCG